MEHQLQATSDYSCTQNHYGTNKILCMLYRYEIWQFVNPWSTNFLKIYELLANSRQHQEEEWYEACCTQDTQFCSALWTSYLVLSAWCMWNDTQFCIVIFFFFTEDIPLWYYNWKKTNSFRFQSNTTIYVIFIFTLTTVSIDHHQVISKKQNKVYVVL